MISTQSFVTRSSAQFFCAAEPKYSRCSTVTGYFAAISTVRSFEKESTSRISSANSTDSMHSPTLTSSL